MTRWLPALLVGSLFVLGPVLPAGAVGSPAPGERVRAPASRPHRARQGANPDAKRLGPPASRRPHGVKQGANNKPARPKPKFLYAPWSPPPVLLPLRPGDRLGGFPTGTPRAILVWAYWSRPSILEKQLLEEVTASGSAAASRVQVVTLDADDPESANPILMLGGAPALPVLYLVSADGMVRRRFVGWPARNPQAVRTVLIRELTALAAR